jgi:hypothetical protein
MKKFLLGGTALAAASVIAPGAKAEGGMKPGIGGRIVAADEFADQNGGRSDAGYQPTSDQLNVGEEIYFKGRATLDNGLTMGAHVDLQGASQIEERWIYLQGGWGELRLGDDKDARTVKSNLVPRLPANGFATAGPFFTLDNSGPGQVVSTVSTIRNASEDSAKLTYFTPGFLGFQLAVSYAPGGQQDHPGLATANTNTCPQMADALSVGASYSGDILGVTVAAGGGYTAGRPACNQSGEGDKPQISAVGVNLSYAGFSAGASIMFADKILSDPTTGRAIDNDTEFELGAAYVHDAITVGIGWNRGMYDRGGLGTDILDQARVGAGFAVGPGISLGATIGYFDYGCASCNDNKGWQTGVGAKIVF